jgi:glycosyltransferase involved in cell wall biosynthesis
VRGWATEPGEPEAIRAVGLRIAGEVVVVAAARLPRPDVARAGFRSSQCGFALPLHPPLSLETLRSAELAGTPAEVIDLATGHGFGPVPLPDALSAAGSLPDPALRALLAEFDFSSYEEVAALLFESGPPRIALWPAFPSQGPAFPHQEGPPEPGAPSEEEGPWRDDPFLRHLRAKWGATEPAAAAARLDVFLRWFLTQYGPSLPTREAYLPPGLVRELSAPVSDEYLTYSGEPRIVALAAAWSGWTSGTVDSPSGTTDSAWLFLQAMRRWAWPISILPPSLRRYWTEPVCGSIVSLSRYDWTIHQGSETYRVRYPLDRPSALLAYSFDRSLQEVCHSDTSTIRVWEALESAETFEFWRAPVGPGAVLSRWETLLVAFAQRRNWRLVPEGEFWNTAAARDLFDRQVYRRHPQAARYRPATVPPPRYFAKADPDQHVLLLGHLENATGLSVNARMFRDTVQRLGLAALEADVDSGVMRPACPGRAPRVPVAIACVNAENLPESLWNLFGRWRRLPYLMGFFLWELSRVCPQQRLGLQMADRILAPSRFVADLFAREHPEKVRYVGKSISIPEPLPVVRERFGWTSEEFVFLTAFDFHSMIERKNPLAAFLGFRAAFPETVRDVRLIVKGNGAAPGTWRDPNRQWQRIQALAQADPRILLINEHWDFQRFLGLIAMADCVVSSHRAEGFGYVPAFALSLERGVIATGYSGTTDFCTVETSIPVAAPLVRVRPGEFLWDTEGLMWADPEPSEVGQAMRQAYEDRAGLALKAAAGRELMLRTYSPAAFSARLEALLRDDGCL